MSQVRVRFAPSPTGRLHLGNARTALINWLFARQSGGRMVLRVEDTDPVRSAAAFEAGQVAALRWLGIDWDEGPDKGGPLGPYRQSERLKIYEDFAAELIEAGRAYPCYCTEEELAAQRALCLRQGRPPRYSGRCRELSQAERRDLEAKGLKPALRFKVEPGRISVRDLIHGRVDFRGEEVGDFVIVRSSGRPSYNFACVVDDHLMEISHVIRGEDHLANTPRQFMIYRFFSWPEPAVAHHSLLVGQDRAKLAKRHGATQVEQMKRSGLLPQALVNYLAFIGGGLSRAGEEVLDPAGLMEGFDLARLGKAPAVFDYDKLNWFNLQHLRRLDPQALSQVLIEWWRSQKKPPAAPGGDGLVRAVALGRENAANLADLGEWVAILSWTGDGPDAIYDEPARAALAGPEVGQVLRAALENLGRPGWLEDLGRATGLRGRRLYQPLRLALTGREHGPRLDDLIEFLGPERTRGRLEAALELTGVA